MRMHANGHHHEPLPPPDREATTAYLASVAQALGDTPETVIARQFLRQGSAEVLCVGMPEDLEGLIIQSRDMPEEPMAFGTSATAIAELLPHLVGWACINVPANLADDLIEPVATTAEASGVRLLDDVHHVLRRPVDPELKGAARLLTPEDEPLLELVADTLVGNFAERLVATVQDGHVAAVIEGDGIVAIANTFATSERYADIGVVTHPDWRGRGYGTNVAAVVAGAIQNDGRTPIWSCGATNLPSMAIAARLGFEEVFRRVYLIPEWDEDTNAP
jgi:predicted GNAT family acetyltransferase